MGAQWKHAGRLDANQKRGLIFGKLAKEIAVAARLGDPNPELNARLRAAVEAARKNSVPRDTIERAIKKGAGLLDGTVTYDLVTYEGIGPHKVPVIVECLTDNKNRTASNVRTLFRKYQLGSIGSVAWMFDRVGIIEAVHKDANQDAETAAIESGAQNVEPLEGDEVADGQTGARFFTDPSDVDTVNKQLTGSGWAISKSELGYMPKTPVDLSDEQRKEVYQFLGEIDEDDDVHRVYPGVR